MSKLMPSQWQRVLVLFFVLKGNKRTYPNVESTCPLTCNPASGCFSAKRELHKDVQCSVVCIGENAIHNFHSFTKHLRKNKEAIMKRIYAY